MGNLQIVRNDKLTIKTVKTKTKEIRMKTPRLYIPFFYAHCCASHKGQLCIWIEQSNSLSHDKSSKTKSKNSYEANSKKFQLLIKKKSKNG